jgi:cytochrome P450 family 6
VDLETNPLEGHLFMLNGETWRTLRNKLSPTFTSGKLKGMYPLMMDCGDLLMKGIEKRMTGGEVEVVDLLECFTIDVIGELVEKKDASGTREKIIFMFYP